MELSAPHREGYEFKAIVANKDGIAKTILSFHNGRSTQENIFSELKSECNMDYVPTRGLLANHLYLLPGIFAHNLYRELQMATRRGGHQRRVDAFSRKSRSGELKRFVLQR